MRKLEKIIPSGSINLPFLPSPNSDEVLPSKEEIDLLNNILIKIKVMEEKEKEDVVKLTNETIIKSVDYDQGNIIKNIIKLHIPSGKIDCDITMSKGNFYRKTGIELPTHKFDKFPQREDTIKIEDKILLDDESVDSLMCDLPFLVGSRKDVHSYDPGSCLIGKRFEQYGSVDDLITSYKLWIKESFRVLKKNGILIFKTQPTVSGGKQYFIDTFSFNEAVKCGFYPKDRFILVAKTRIIGPHHHKQQHSRRFESYFLVFKKEKFKNVYL